MAYKALATGPVSFLDTNSNQQEIPLSAISFGLNGPDASSWSNYNAANSTIIQQLLQQLFNQGLLTPDLQAAPSAALSVTANEAGTTGNVIQVTISNVSTSANTMTVAVSATEVYPGLTTATIGDALGISAGAANGLVFLQHNNNQPPGNYTQSTSSGPDFTYAIPEAADNTQTAFILAAVDSGDAADAANISVSVVPDPAPATTFTLTASWSKSQDNVTLAMLTTPATNPFALLVNFTPGGGLLPAPGTVTLQGGATASSTPAAPATATILSS